MSRATVDRIQEFLRANPGAKVRTDRGPDGRTRYSIVGPDPLAQLERRCGLRLLKAEAHVAAMDIEEDVQPRREMAALKDRAARARRLVG